MCILQFFFFYVFPSPCSTSSTPTASRVDSQCRKPKPPSWKPLQHGQLSAAPSLTLKWVSRTETKQKQILETDCMPPVTLSACTLAANIWAQLAEPSLGRHQQARRRRHEPKDKGTMDGIYFSHRHLQMAHHGFVTLQDMKVMYPFSRITEFHHKRHSFHMKISTAARGNSFVFESSHVSGSPFSSKR